MDESTILNESSVVISENDFNLLEEIYKDKISSNKELSENYNSESYKTSLKNEIADILNNNIKFSSNPNVIMEDDLSIIKSFSSEVNKDNKFAFSTNKELNLSNSGTIEGKASKNKNFEGSFVNGSYIKTLEPDRVIKIKIGEVVYGYFYIEVRGKNELIHPKNVYSALTLRQTVDLTSSDTSMIDDPKIRLITDLFAKNIGKKIDKEFIANNKEFKTIIYELLKKDYIYNNNIQITYFEPNIIKHLMVEEGADGYGVSILKNICFTAKLYLSVLVTTLLTKISRSQEHRTFYIDTGLSEDVEGVVNSFIRDVETKDVKISDTQSIDSIFTTIGSNSNYYIPTVNGERAVEIDTTAGLNVDLDNDLMEYLRKTMISGIGIPASMLNYADEIEFSRSLSMQNGIFLRGVIVKQKKLTAPFSSLYQTLYENEFGSSTVQLFSDKEIKENKKIKKQQLKNKEVSNTSGDDEYSEEINSVDISAIKVNFPSPSSLNATNLADQINTGNSIVQAITEAMFDQNDQNPNNEHKFKFTQEMNKKYIPNIDWNEIEDIYYSTKEEAVRERLESKISNPNGNEGE